MLVIYYGSRACEASAAHGPWVENVSNHQVAPTFEFAGLAALAVGSRFYVLDCLLALSRFHHLPAAKSKAYPAKLDSALRGRVAHYEVTYMQGMHRHLDGERI